eukprot:m.1369 g.1369  ORF g.1369 m.1369 type:complete len:94 (-) comp846_c0_seq1:43-324(-)
MGIDEWRAQLDERHRWMSSKMDLYSLIGWTLAWLLYCWLAGLLLCVHSFNYSTSLFFPSSLCLPTSCLLFRPSCFLSFSRCLPPIVSILCPIR